MKYQVSTVAAFAIAGILMSTGPSRADDPTPDPPRPPKATPTERAEGKIKRKAALQVAKKTGQMTPDGEAAPTPPYKPGGTHATRSAERKANRKAMAEAERKGEVPKYGEGGPKQ